MKKILIVLLFVLACFTLLTLTGCDIFGIASPHEHTVVEHEGRAPTCTEKGYEPYKTCTTCDEYSTYKELPPLDHDYSGGYIENGIGHGIFCSRCGNVDKAGHHTWDGGKVTVAPECLRDGVRTYTCVDCGAQRSEVVAALDHDFSGGYKSVGEMHRLSCTRCNEYTEAEHEWDLGELKEPTCTASGVQYYVCSVCGAKRGEGIRALGHSYSAGYVSDEETHSKQCERCSYLQSYAHSYGEWITVSDATCSDEGRMVRECQICHRENSMQLPTLDHIWSIGAYLEPTCAEVGKQYYNCMRCGAEKYDEIPMIDEHFEGEWRIESYPTAFVDGFMTLHCVVCDKIIGEQSIPCDAKSMPSLYFEGDYTAATNKKNEVKMSLEYVHPSGESFSAYATIKVQGSTSVSYPKKNYTVKLYKDDTYESKLKYDFGWGKENKYVIKANWVDFSQARNVVSCKLWGDIIATRPESANKDRLVALKTNGGAIDGFPIAVYMNGEFYGLYTLNVPKDEWMFGMEDSETEALLAADDWNHTDFNEYIVGFKELSNGDIVSLDGSGWELIYCGSDDYSWVAESFDSLIRFCRENDGDAFREGISAHLDVDAAIDYVIFMYANYMRDNASKNMLWATYDGKVWIPSAYDQDGTFGQSWDGVNSAPPAKNLPLVKNGKIDPNITFGPSTHPVNFILWIRILNCFTDKVIARYDELRGSVLSVENITRELRAFEDAIPGSMFDAELEVWGEARQSWWESKRKPGEWDYNTFHYDYMYTWVEERMMYYDQAMDDIRRLIR